MVQESEITMRALAPGAVEPLIALFEAIAEKEGWQPEGQLRVNQNAATYFAAYLGEELAGGMQVVLPTPGEPFSSHAWA